MLHNYLENAHKFIFFCFRFFSCFHFAHPLLTHMHNYTRMSVCVRMCLHTHVEDIQELLRQGRG